MMNFLPLEEAAATDGGSMCPVSDLLPSAEQTEKERGANAEKRSDRR